MRRGSSERTCRTPCGTAANNAPERWRRGTYTQAVDVWALGCLLYEMLTGRRAFTGATAGEMLQQIRVAGYDRSPLKHTSSLTRDMLLNMFTLEPSRRPRTIDVLRHKALTDTKGLAFVPAELGGAGLIPLSNLVTLIRNTQREPGTPVPHGSQSKKQTSPSPTGSQSPLPLKRVPKKSLLPTIGNGTGDSDRSPSQPREQAGTGGNDFIGFEAIGSGSRAGSIAETHFSIPLPSLPGPGTAILELRSRLRRMSMEDPFKAIAPQSQLPGRRPSFPDIPNGPGPRLPRNSSTDFQLDFNLR
jgi:serine/threonine protein kinase